MLLKSALWLSVNLAVFLSVPFGGVYYLDAEMKADRLANPNLPTDGDSMGIPFFEMAVATFVLLVALNGVVGVAWWLARRRAQESEFSAPIAKP